MRRVLILCEFASLNGGERSLLALLRHLPDHGFQPVVAAPPVGPLARELASQAVDLVPFIRTPGDDQAVRRGQLHSLLVAQAPDLLHANSVSMSRLSGPVALALGLASVGHLRDIMRLSGQAVRDLCQHGRLISVSNAVRQSYIDQGIEPDRIDVLYNGVNLQRFRSRSPTGALARELSLPESARFVLSIGQVGMRKGLDTLVDAASIVLQHHPQVYFLHAGVRYSQKEEAVAFEQHVRRQAARLSGHFRWLGLRDDVPRILNEVTLIAHAARQEPLGRILLESAACGVPVVATDVGGTREIFPPGCQAACLVPPDRPHPFAAALIELLHTPKRCVRMRAAGRERAEQVFDAKDVARLLARQYRLAIQ